MPQCARILVASAALLLIGNVLYSRQNTYTTSYIQRPAVESPSLNNGGTSADQQRKRRIEELEKELSTLKGPSGGAVAAAAAAVGSSSLGSPAQQPQQIVPAAAAAQPIEAHMPPPPPPAQAAEPAEVVPESERVVVPANENLPAALRAMRKGTDLFISFSSANMAPFALNWVANLRRAGIGLASSTSTQVLIGALDDKMEGICNAQGIAVLPIQANLPGVNLRFDYSAYKRMAALKVAFYTRILKMGFNVWACDADTGWMGNPRAFVNEYPMQHVDMLTTTDCIDVDGDERGGCWHVDHNTGLVYMRARPIVIEFTLAWKAKIQNMRDIMVRDQAALNLLMRENFRSKVWQPPPDPEGGSAVRPIYSAWNDKLKIARLPLRYFANGHTFFVQRMYQKEGHPPPFVVHMTYQYGDSSAFPYGKRQRMREGRVWQVDPPSYFNEGNYLAVAPEAASLPIDYLPGNVTTAEAAERFNREEAQLRRVLRDALGLAIALNRTLIMPRMLCYCDNIWKEMKHCRVGGAFGMTLPFDCPADHIINLPRWFQGDLPIQFREPGFLTDPRLSPEIKSSWVRLKTPPMTAEEAKSSLAPYKGARVIELAVARDRFCGFEDASKASLFKTLAPALVPYSRHFCYEDGFKVGCPASQGCIPFYSPCCGGAPGRHFPCKHLIPPPAFYSTASDLPSFCANRKSMGGVEKLEVPADYPDLSPNPRSRQYHKIDDEFRRGFKRQANGKS